MEMETVAEGLLFPEGPVALGDGSVLIVELRRQTLSRVTPDGKVSVVATLGGAPNGVAIGPDGAAYVCNNGGFKWLDRPDGITTTNGTPDEYRGGSIQRVDIETGEWTTCFHAHRLGFIDQERAKLVRRSAAQPRPAGVSADITNGETVALYPVQIVTHLSTGRPAGRR